MERPRKKLQDILQFLRQSYNYELKSNTEINDIYLQLEKLYNDNKSLQRNFITKAVEVFVQVQCRSSRGVLVTCLAKFFGSEDFKCLEVREVNLLLNWLKIYLLNTNSEDLHNIMQLLKNILRADGQHARSVLDAIVVKAHQESLLKQLNADNNLETILEIIQCFDLILSANTADCCDYNKEQVDFYVTLGAAILDLHYKQKHLTASNSDIWSVLVLSSVSLLTKVCTFTTEFPNSHLSELLGFVIAYWQYGCTSGTLQQCQLKKVAPSQQTLYHSEDDSDTSKEVTAGGKINKQRKLRTVQKGKRQSTVVSKTNISFNKLSELVQSIELKTSESDSSETEISNNIEQQRLRQVYSKVRLNVLLLLGCVARTQRRCVMYGYWHAIFPHTLNDAQQHILHIAQNDSNIRCRSAALQVTAQLLYESKQFLKQAESQKKQTSYLSFSANLAMTIVKIYNNLLAVIKNEAYIPVLIQALKCLAVLVQATSFEQLENGIIQRVVQQVRPLLFHRDNTVQVSALIVFEFLLLDQKLLPELAVAIGFPDQLVVTDTCDASKWLEEEAELEYNEDSDQNDNIEPKTSEEAKIKNKKVAEDLPNLWLMKHIIRKLLYTNDNLPNTNVRIECLQLLCALSAHFVLYISFLLDVAEIIKNSLTDDSQAEIRLHAARCCDTLAYHISNYLAAAKKATIPINILQQCKKFWSVLLPPMQKVARANNEQIPLAVKASISDAISNMGECIFENQLQAEKMNLVIFLTGIANDSNEDALVRAAAVRALAVFAQFPSLRDDFVFIENAIDLSLSLCSCSNQIVRIKAVWSLGNISDALVTQAIKNKSNSERISDELYCRLMRTATEACLDNDKVRCNAVRTVGNLTRLITKEQFMLESYKLLFKNAIEKLIDCIRSARNAKVKWNACYAIGNLICNEDLFIATKDMTEPNWQSTLYPLLCNTIVQQPNFKVRISATAVICNINERSHFGTYFESFWCATLQAVEQTFHLDNYYEYNHRDQLQEQLCLSISHLINCANDKDIIAMSKQLTERMSVIQNIWQRVLSRMVPEKAAPLLLCIENLNDRLRSQYTMGREQLSAIQLIVDVFKQQ